ncbi:hypothetical protein F0310_04335 (plasmid) [Borrelia sp. A-FGy1]|uniref:hypothetical protein n=1 Tax=Borrelia sp. A-FGy1 TaxID=2608247 RepID=UPI0015F644B3|nr:hypothetical protein [Borrelia sp. A-FGy1]QMU99646.1 hypothetical protein F0310_04335 [Borrelia sp. A-FGy1]
MVNVIYIIYIFFWLFLSLNLIARASSRPFNFKICNFERDIEYVYELSYEYRNSILIKTTDSMRHLKVNLILKRITGFEIYYYSLLNLIRNDFFLKVRTEFLRKSNKRSDVIFLQIDHRIQDIIEIPIERLLEKDRSRLFNFSNKNLIEETDYSKLFISMQMRDIEFLESYITRQLGLKLEISNYNSGNLRLNVILRPNRSDILVRSDEN